jgi:hypothetical protein
MTKITTVVLPPQIQTYFDKTLLSIPMKFGDDLERIHNIFCYIKQVAEKYRNYPKEYARWKLLEKEYMDLYERTKTKEKNQEAKAKNRTKGPFYFIRMSNKRFDRLFSRLRFARKKTD